MDPHVTLDTQMNSERQMARQERKPATPLSKPSKRLSMPLLIAGDFRTLFSSLLDFRQGR